MATQKDVILSLLNKGEVLYWAKKNRLEVEEFPGGLYVDDWKVTFNTQDNITTVERRLDEPQEL